MKIIAITQARTASTLLPDNILKKVADKTLLQIHIDRVKMSERITEHTLATTNKVGDIIIREIAQSNSIRCYQGSEKDVLDRFYQAALPQRPEYIVRLTADCPLVDAQLIDKLIDYAIENDLDYASNTLDNGYPMGQNIEVFKFTALEDSWYQAGLQAERKHVTIYIQNNSDLFGKGRFRAGSFSEGYDYGHLKMSVNSISDLETIRQLISDLGANKPWLDYAIRQDANEAMLNLTKNQVATFKSL